MDNQPFSSVMEEFDFANLLHVLGPRYQRHIPSQKYFIDKVLPLVHDDVKSGCAHLI